ncbi:MAG: coiled coil domain-containing protein [Rhodobacteraceae bacterium]|nr:coiled coil domain-containing protein [Paracoccaceae bacterium]
MSVREKYQAKLKTNLDALEAEIKKLTAKANKAKADAKVKLDMELGVLKAQQQVAKTRLTALRRASDEAWGDIKIGADAAWKDLSKAFTAARKRFAKS